MRRAIECRACHSPLLAKVLDLGSQVPANNFVLPGEQCHPAAPLEVLYCKDCSLAQLSVVLPPDGLYRNYAYRTNPGKTMLDHFDLILAEMLKATTHRRTMLEIGSNDGSFLRRALQSGFDRVLGVDPAENLAKEANDSGIETLAAMFGPGSVILAERTIGTPDVIVARHVFAHVDDWRDFIRNIEWLCDENTSVFIEVPYAGDTVSSFQYDQCYSEHLSFVSVKSINALLKGTRMSLASVNRYGIHGGAIMLKLRKDYTGPTEPDDLITLEMWKSFGDAAGEAVNALREQIRWIVGSGKTVAGYGASAKSSVWCQACGFTRKEIQCIYDNTPEKVGKLSPGTDIPILAEEMMALNRPDYCILWAWNFSREIMEKQKAFTELGGHWIVPVPKLTIIPQ